jgi:hypothetical protein
VLALAAREAERGDGGGGVAQQPFPVGRIRPNLGAVARPDFGLLSLDQRIDCGGIDVGFLDQNRFERTHAQLDIGQLAAVVIVAMTVHCCILPHGGSSN